MLDTETKRRIDTCRDILVGKVPDPKSQVEQITIALIYKFMDDMDREAVENGGKASFFKGEFKRFAWSNIFDPRLGGYDLIQLYGDALVRMNQNPGIPPLFRDIFKNAFLPYRDPETLKSFLKEINSFTYDHSEKLGDAFEYLLSVLGSQGEAGQFRTPRHIIDFIVAVVEPKKTETVLDPACGTAGFLISAYKHILQNEEKLTHTQRKRLLENFTGYDISPDMVRLSLVNLYLHGFPSPKIHEYDTLTSEQRWNEKADVILANPPFMTPKGGIRPHKRFSIAANRSEVLFVDYIAEHLNPSGRAGVIVPEGIIFQSANAYKALRKMLVESCLWAVVSLPAGVFNPYAGVKTSILLIDRVIAKKTDGILFVKIENDGFDLGAQRRRIDKNDLPAALEYMAKYKSALSAGKKPKEADFAHVVKKEEIAASGDYNLTGERYRKFEHHTQSEWPMVELGEACEQERRQILPDSAEANKLPYIGLEHIESESGKILNIFSDGNNSVKSLTFAFDHRHVLYGKLRPYLNKVALPDFSGRCSTEIIPLLPTRINRRLLALFLRRKETTDYVMQSKTGSRMPRADINLLLKMKIPLPPLEVQERIVNEIEGYQKILDAARQIVESYKPTIKINPDWPIVNFKDYIFFQEGPGIRNWQFTQSGIKLLNVKNIVKGELILDNSDKYISKKEYNEKYKHFLVEDGDIILASSGATYGKNAYFKDPGYPVIVNTSTIRLHSSDQTKILQGYIKIIVDSDLFKSQIDKLITGAAQPNFGPAHLKQIKIPLPLLKVQKKIVAEIETEQEIVNANKNLINIYEKKIRSAIADVWGNVKE